MKLAECKFTPNPDVYEPKQALPGLRPDGRCKFCWCYPDKRRKALHSKRNIAQISDCRCGCHD